MGQLLSAAQVAGPVATFGGADAATVSQAIDGQLEELRGAINAAYGLASQRDAAASGAALKWLREWRDHCLSGPDRLRLLPCMLERAFDTSTRGEDCLEVKFLCTLCPPWARQVLPETPSETATIGSWAAAGAAACAAVAPASARQFCSGIAVATVYACGQNEGASPLQAAYETLARVFGDGLGSGDPAAVLTVLESFDALITESTNRALALPPEVRFRLKRSIFTQVSEMLTMVDSFVERMPQPIDADVLKCGCELVARCVELATQNVVTEPSVTFTMQRPFLEALPRSRLFDAATRYVADEGIGATTRAACNLFVSVAGLSNDPSELTLHILQGVFESVGCTLNYALRSPGEFDVVDVECLVDVVATYCELLVETAAERFATSSAGSPEAVAADGIIDNLRRAMDVVIKLPNADPIMSSPVHACIAVLGRSLSPIVVPPKEPGDPNDIYAELEASNRRRSAAAKNLHDMLLLPALDALLTFARTGDSEWTETRDAFITRKALSIARNSVSCVPLASPVRPKLGFGPALRLDHAPDEPTLRLGEDDDAVVNVCGGDACENYAAAVRALTGLIGQAPFAADDWLPLAFANEDYVDPTVAQYVASRCDTVVFRASDDALLLATALALRNNVQGLEGSAALTLCCRALQASTDLRAVQFVSCACALAIVLAGQEGIPASGLEELAAAMFASRQALCRTSPLPRFDDPTDSVNAGVHLLWRLAASRICTRLLASGSMNACACIANGEHQSVLSGELGGLSLVINALWVVRSLFVSGGVSDAAVHAFEQAVIQPVLKEGQLVTWLGQASRQGSEQRRAAALKLVSHLSLLFADTLEGAASSQAHVLAGAPCSELSDRLSDLCGAGVPSAAVTLVCPVCEVANSAEMAALPQQVFAHVAGMLPNMESNDALDTAAALFAAFGAIRRRLPDVAASCAATIYQSAAVMLPALSAASTTDLAVDWVGLRTWMTRLIATLDATADVAQVDASFAVPHDAVAAAAAAFGKTWRSRAAMTTLRHDDDDDAEDWVVASHVRTALANSLARWCHGCAQGFEALSAVARALARDDAHAASVAGQLNSVASQDDAASLFLDLLGDRSSTSV